MTKNEKIYYIKGLAIISVICAHCNSIPNNIGGFSYVCSLILQNIGTFGVICFFVLSGFLFHYEEGHLKRFFEKKLKYLCVPWLLSATCVYLYVYLRKPPITVISWINFVLGNGSYCYYMTVLMIFYLIFTVVPFMRTNIAFFVCEAITIVSDIWLYQWGDFTPYLNLLNWIGIFALGMQISKNKDFFRKMKNRILQGKWIFTILYIMLFSIQIYRGKGGWYWNGWNVIICWGGAMMIFIAAHLIKEKSLIGKFLHFMGEYSFGIYIWHMPIAGVVASVMSRSFLVWFVIFRPIIVVGIALCALLCITKLIRIMRLTKIGYIIGIRS